MKIKIILFCILILSSISLLKVVTNSSYPDFKAHYYGAGHLIHGQNPYLPDKNYFTSQVYPTTDLLFMSFFTLLPYAIAERLWVGISIVLLILSMFMLFKLYNIKKKKIIIILFTACNLSFPVKFTLGMGQINMLILFLLCLFLYLYNIKRNIFAGFLLALMCGLKFFPLLLLPYFLLKRQFKLLAITLLTLLIFIIICLVIVPLHTNLYFVQRVLPDLLTSWKADYYNQALSGFIARELPFPFFWQYFKFIFSLILVLITMLVIFQKERNQSKWHLMLEISAVIVLNVIINNFSWQHHFVFIFPAYICAFIYITENKLSPKFLYILATSFVLVSLNLKNPAIFPVIIQSHVFYGGILLWGLIVTLQLVPIKYKDDI